MLAGLLVVAGGWAFNTSVDGVLVLDDIRAIERNPTIRTLWPITTPLSPPSASTVAGRPIANLSFAIDYALASGSPRRFHSTNLLIHLAAGRVLTDRLAYRVNAYRALAK